MEVLFPLILVQQASQLVSHIDHHDLLARAGQVGNLALDGLGHTRVDGTAESTVGGNTNDQMLAGLLLWRFDLSLLVQSWKGNGGYLVLCINTLS